MKMVPWILAAIVVTAGCGSDDTPTERKRSPARALVGEWRTVNLCTDGVAALKAANLAEFNKQIVGGVRYWDDGRTRPSCRGAKPVRHSHTFYHDGRFASFDENAQQVDDSTYVVHGDRLTIGQPPDDGRTARFQIDGNTAAFEVVVPDCKDDDCRRAAAFAIATFFPRTYRRVPK